MGNIRPYSELKPFLEDLEAKGLEYNKPDESRIGPNNVLAVVYKKENGYSACKMFYKESPDAQVREQLLMSGFPKAGVEAVLDTEHVIKTQVLQYVKELLDKWPITVVLSGPEQIGKTYAGIYLARTLLARRKIHSPAFVRANEIRKQKTEEGWGFCFNDKADLLLLDDIGSESVLVDLYNENQDKKALIFELIDFRTGEKLPMVITTNLSPADLKARYSTKTMARLTNQGLIKEFKDE